MVSACHMKETGLYLTYCSDGDQVVIRPEAFEADTADARVKPEACDGQCYAEECERLDIEAMSRGHNGLQLFWTWRWKRHLACHESRPI